MLRAITGGKVFTGDELLPDHAVLIDSDTIVDVLPQERLSADIPVACDLEGAYLLPGFIDLQVNGGGGVMFNSAPTIDTLRRIGAAHSRFGTTAFLPTLITDDYDVMAQAISAVSDAMQQRVPGVIGIHLEGPFLNAAKKGAHDAEKIRAIDAQGMQLLTALPEGKTLVTIAPEQAPPEMITQLHRQGVIVCAGHSAATYAQTRSALAAGVHGFTHLFNAMTPLQSREPGMVGAALEDSHSWFGIIADGHHVHPAAFKVAVAAKNRGGAILVTDAMSTVGAEEKSFVLNGETIHCVDGRCVNAAGSLAGSDLDMITAVKNAADFADIDWLEAVRMASLYPARALGLADRLGRIQPGYAANLVAVDAQLHVLNTWVGGNPNAWQH